MKAFNQEKALVSRGLLINCETDCETDGSSAALILSDIGFQKCLLQIIAAGPAGRLNLGPGLGPIMDPPGL